MKYLITILFFTVGSVFTHSEEPTGVEAELISSLSPLLQIGSESFINNLDSLPYKKDNIEKMKACLKSNELGAKSVFVPVFTKVLNEEEINKVIITFRKEHFQKYMASIRSQSSKLEISSTEMKEIVDFTNSEVGKKLAVASSNVNQLAQEAVKYLFNKCPKTLLTGKQT